MESEDRLTDRGYDRNDRDSRPRKVKRRQARAKLRCPWCGRILWVTDSDDPDKLLTKHRFQRCKGAPIQQWEKDRRLAVYGELDEKPKKKRTKDKRHG